MSSCKLSVVKHMSYHHARNGDTFKEIFYLLTTSKGYAVAITSEPIYFYPITDECPLTVGVPHKLDSAEVLELIERLSRNDIIPATQLPISESILSALKELYL